MRTAIRLLIFAAVVAAITLTIAPPVRTSAEAVVTVDTRTPTPPAEVSGTAAESITTASGRATAGSPLRSPERID